MFVFRQICCLFHTMRDIVSYMDKSEHMITIFNMKYYDIISTWPKCKTMSSYITSNIPLVYMINNDIYMIIVYTVATLYYNWLIFSRYLIVFCGQQAIAEQKTPQAKRSKTRTRSCGRRRHSTRISHRSWRPGNFQKWSVLVWEKIPWKIWNNAGLIWFNGI